MAMIDCEEDLRLALAKVFKTEAKISFTADELSEFLLEVAGNVGLATEAVVELGLQSPDEDAEIMTEAHFRGVAAALRWLVIERDEIEENSLSFRAWLRSLSHRQEATPDADEATQGEKDAYELGKADGARELKEEITASLRRKLAA
jgi:hypothetical protein